MSVDHPDQPPLSGLGVRTLRELPAVELPALADRIRDFLVSSVCATGGHLGPNLGVVELTLALHRVFDSPRDTIVFDTGHQTYVHKLLIGRIADFATLRQPGGISGYPSPEESEHDVVANSHASTALSYADGLAKARQLTGEPDRAVVAVIGDGALTGGMAWEALNNIGSASRLPVVIVLNDNGRSYAPTHGAIAHHLQSLKSGGAALHRNVFTDMGLMYLGPVDGHDVTEVEGALRRARECAHPVVVHVVTVKGKGHAPAEGDEADHLHAVSTVDPATGRAVPAGPAPPSWTGVFGRALASLAERRPDVVAITAAMLRPTGLHPMQQLFPERVFNVGIAEQHAVTSAAGMAMAGLHPVVAIYATFLNRAFDQVVMDVALHRLPVTFVLDRAGITGPDGSSHHGMWDLSLLTAVPGLRISAPRDAPCLEALLQEAVECGDGPSVLRLPKADVGADIPALARMDGMDILHRSAFLPLDVLLAPVGPLARAALEAAKVLEADGIGVTVADARWVHPVNPALTALAARHRLAVTVEDGVSTGGIGSEVAAACRDRQVTTPVTVPALPRAFIAHGTRASLLGAAGLDGAGIVRAVHAAQRFQPHAHRDAPGGALPAS
ncbi:1-deoxy-D-xylulose-5-phosphate synthase [Streptomyces sp. NPDC058701]|uniref:1-deoxy-D-xylulose-5-phosphate synthase n=1 Tax=Streptomyces sp. NPDC058701 TaxID=3346608 RepID=UPI0036610597